MQENMGEKEGAKLRVKICYVITKGNWGGAQKYVYTLATNLPKDKYEPVVICGPGEILRQKLLEARIKVYTIENLKRDVSFVSEIKSFFEIFKIIRNEHPNVLHLNSPKAGGLGALVGRILFVKNIIYTAHGWTFNEERPVHQNILIFILSWFTILLCHKVIVIAPREEEQAKDLPLVNNEKIVLIRNGVETTKFKEKETARKELSSKFGLTDDNTIWFGTIAELHKNKGLEYALEAVRKINTPFKYFILGGGEKRQDLENQIKILGLEEKVFLTGFIEEAPQFLKAFDIFMLTSIKEGLPYTILEAGLASLPVIATNVGGTPDIIESGVSGILVTKARSGEITRAIEYMIERPEERKKFGLKLEEKIKKDFSLLQMMDKTLELYR